MKKFILFLILASTIFLSLSKAEIRVGSSGSVADLRISGDTLYFGDSYFVFENPVTIGDTLVLVSPDREDTTLLYMSDSYFLIESEEQVWIKDTLRVKKLELLGETPETLSLDMRARGRIEMRVEETSANKAFWLKGDLSRNLWYVSCQGDMFLLGDFDLDGTLTGPKAVLDTVDTPRLEAEFAVLDSIDDLQLEGVRDITGFGYVERKEIGTVESIALKDSLTPTLGDYTDEQCFNEPIAFCEDTMLFVSEKNIQFVDISNIDEIGTAKSVSYAPSLEMKAFNRLDSYRTVLVVYEISGEGIYLKTIGAETIDDMTNYQAPIDSIKITNDVAAVSFSSAVHDINGFINVTLNTEEGANDSIKVWSVSYTDNGDNLTLVDSTDVCFYDTAFDTKPDWVRTVVMEDGGTEYLMISYASNESQRGGKVFTVLCNESGELSITQELRPGGTIGGSRVAIACYDNYLHYYTSTDERYFVFEFSDGVVTDTLVNDTLNSQSDIMDLLVYSEKSAILQTDEDYYNVEIKLIRFGADFSNPTVIDSIFIAYDWDLPSEQETARISFTPDSSEVASIIIVDANEREFKFTQLTASSKEEWLGDYNLEDVNNIAALSYETDVSPSELGYLDGVTSAIQTQIDTKVSIEDTAGTAPGDYTSAQAMVDTASAHRALINSKLNKADSTGTGADSYATRSALVDTASDIRGDIPDLDNLDSLYVNMGGNTFSTFVSLFKNWSDAPQDGAWSGVGIRYVHTFRDQDDPDWNPRRFYWELERYTETSTNISSRVTFQNLKDNDAIDNLILNGRDSSATVPGKIKGERYQSEVVEITTTSDAVSVSQCSVLRVNTNGGDVTIGGFTGGVDGQILHLYNTAENDVIIEDDEGTGNQDIKTTTGGDITITNEGGATLIYDGTSSVWRLTAIGQ